MIAGEDRRLQALALEAAEHRRVGRRLPLGAQERRARGRAAARAAAGAACRPCRSGRAARAASPSSSRSAQSSAISSARRRPVWTSASRTSRSRSARPARRRGGCSRGGEEPRELLLGQPVGFLLRLRRRLELEERVGQSAAAAEPAQEAAQEAEAAVVGRRRRVRAPLVVGEIVDDRRLLEDAAVAIAAPGEQVVDRDPVGGDRALAPPRRLEAAQPVVACAASGPAAAGAVGGACLSSPSRPARRATASIVAAGCRCPLRRAWVPAAVERGPRRSGRANCRRRARRA